MTAPDVITIDFETKAIEPRPHYPPKPVGVAIQWPRQPGQYHAFAHPEGNNTTELAARGALITAYTSGLPLLFHNPKFDLDVAETHWGLEAPWTRVQDSLILAFLDDPYARDLGLKPLAARKLGLPADEMDDVRQWLVDHRVINAALKKEWGGYISEAPGDLVGRYAVGDTHRSQQLWQHLYQSVMVDHQMQQAYERELQLMPIMLENERQGVRVDLTALSEDVSRYSDVIARVDKALYKHFGATFNVDSGDELGEQLFRRYPGVPWRRTPTGRLSTSKDNLLAVLPERYVLALLQYRASVGTCLKTFMRPWLKMAAENNGRVHTQWHQTKQEEAGGARTGRLSSSPNFQNIPTIKSVKFIETIKLWTEHLKELGFPPLPEVRRYVLPDDDDSILLDRDFAQQELRMLAHFEDDLMLQAYCDKPDMDLHEFARLKITELTGIELTRKQTKNIAFGLLYGMGLEKLSGVLGVDMTTSAVARTAYLNALPGVKTIQENLKWRARRGDHMRTWGGRCYYVEPHAQRDLSYKLFNYMIQGSSADFTKEAILAYNELREHGRLMLTVHDEVLVSCPRRHVKTEMQLLKRAMESMPLDVPMLSDGATGANWATMEDYADA